MVPSFQRWTRSLGLLSLTASGCPWLTLANRVQQRWGSNSCLYNFGSPELPCKRYSYLVEEGTWNSWGSGPPRRRRRTPSVPAEPSHLAAFSKALGMRVKPYCMFQPLATHRIRTNDKGVADFSRDMLWWLVVQQWIIKTDKLWCSKV